MKEISFIGLIVTPIIQFLNILLTNELLIERQVWASEESEKDENARKP